MHARDQRRRPFWHLRRRPDLVTSEIDEELNVHLEMRTEELKARGLPADVARREALRQFGDLPGTRAYCRQQDLEKEHVMQRGLLIEEVAQDLRVGLRGLLRAPMLTLTIIATVGLGIGATTVIFSAVNAALLRPLPYADPAQLVRIYTDTPPNKFPFSVVDYRALEAQQTRFERVAGFQNRAMAFTDGTRAERVPGRIVTWTYFGLVGITPALGRDFTAADTRPGAPRTVIVSHAFWQERLGGRADAIGKPVRLDGVDYALAGVLPATANGPIEYGQSFFAAEQWPTPTRKGPFFITALGRLRHGSGTSGSSDATERAAAAAELRALSQRLFPLWKASYQDSKATWSIVDLKEFAARGLQPVGGLALAAVGLVWLIACTNASNLLIARVTSRRQELAVRTALGASRARIVRYLLAESALLAIGAAAVGLAIAAAGVVLVRDLTIKYVPRANEIALDGTTGWALLLLTLTSGLLFGLIPAIHGTGGPVDETMRAQGRSSTGSVAVRRMRRLLVGAQFAIATPLLIVAGLLLTSLNQLARVDLGFNTHNMITGALLLPTAAYRDDGQMATFWDRLQERVEAMPGIAGMTFSDGVPPNEINNFNNFDLEDAPTPPGQSQPVTPWVGVTPDYFKLLGLSLQEGRLFDERDGNRSNIEYIVVDRAWARRFFPNGSALGKRLKEGGCTSCRWTTVIGVVSDVKYPGLDKPDEGSVYWPMPGRGVTPAEGSGTRLRYLVVRTTADPETVQPALRKTVHDLDPGLPFETQTIDDRVAGALQQPRSLSLLVAGFALVALALSIVGIYGVMAYYVQQHAKDISIRLALGGSQGGVLRLIVGQGMTVVAGGVAIGLVAAFLLARLLSSLLFGIGASDAWTFAGVTSLLLAVALAACCVPAGRAVAMEPAAVLRNE
jgi:putative ABC transport system permease protein